VTTNSPTPDDPLAQPLATVHGIPAGRLDALERLGLRTVGDVLFHLPRSYEDLTDLRSIANLSSEGMQTVEGEVVEIEGRELADGRTVVSVVLSDGGPIYLEGVWFNQPYAARRFRYGQRVAFSAKPKWYRDRWQMSNPRVQVLDGAAGDSPGILPVYPLTEDLRADHLRDVVRVLVERHAHQVPEVLPGHLRDHRNLPDATEALRAVHLPGSLEAARVGRRRFVYEEFLILQLALALRRREVRDRLQAPMLRVNAAVDAHIRRLFPFTLTADQNHAVAEVCADLAQERPMQRLLQADVGAGKTAVAVYALLVAVANKHQAALMAPTEILAQQHAQTLERYLAQSRVRRLLLTGSLTPGERNAALDAIRAGDIDLVIGTQALVQKDVEFAKLGLVVVDEQHKFGVNQRAKMRQLGVDPHYLVMTATPIPRTVALTVFGDLDVSVMREQPPGRQPVKTRWVKAAQRDKVYERFRRGLAEGRQAYVICPLVEESEKLDLKSATETFEELRDGAFKDHRVGLVHGRLDEEERRRVMDAFRAREVQVLVSTSVVEVGVDVPNATLLLIENAERFGLSQLHQLRGRVSRGSVAGECFVLAEPGTDEGKERLRAFVQTTDGFALAEEDARLRGVGEFFGTRQHGLGELRFGDLISDTDLLQLARTDAFGLVTADPGLRHPDHAALRQAVLDRYGETLDLASIG
jgi:ATP-dependent DNA helicase RecG